MALKEGPCPVRKWPCVNQMCKISPCVAQNAEPTVIAERRKLLSGVAGVKAVDMSGIPLLFHLKRTTRCPR